MTPGVPAATRQHLATLFVGFSDELAAVLVWSGVNCHVVVGPACPPVPPLSDTARRRDDVW